MLFSTVASNAMSLEDFSAQQQFAYDGVNGYLKNTWVPSSLKAVQDAVGQVNKGWFNMKTMMQDVYDVSKLRRMMQLIRLIMQDALYVICWNSTHALANLINTTASAVRLSYDFH